MSKLRKTREFLVKVFWRVSDFWDDFCSPPSRITTPPPEPRRRKVCRYCDGRKKILYCLDCQQPIPSDAGDIGCGTENCPQREEDRDCPYCEGRGFELEQPLLQRFEVDTGIRFVDAHTPEEAIRLFAEQVRCLPARSAKSLGWIHGHDLNDCPAPPSPYWRIISRISVPTSADERPRCIYLAIPAEAGEPPAMRLTHDRWAREWSDLSRAPFLSLLWDTKTKSWIEVPTFLRTNGLLKATRA